MPFSGKAKVVVAKRWVNNVTGATASVHGSLPVGDGWEVQDHGFDIFWSGDGTIGRGKPVFETKAEAQGFADGWNAKREARYENAGMEMPN